jgi:hypothetical protein
VARGKNGGGKHSADGGGWWWWRWLGGLARWMVVRLENEVSGCSGQSGGSCGGRGGEPINISRKVCTPRLQRRPQRERPTSGSGDAVAPQAAATARDEVLLTLLIAFCISLITSFHKVVTASVSVLKRHHAVTATDRP